MDHSDLESMRQKLGRLPEPEARPRLGRDQWLGALGVFILVFFSTFPVVIPFIFVHNVRLALRISNGIAIAMLFLCGYQFGRYSGYRPWRMSLWMVLVGLVMVGITIALGG